ncbi:MAG TPA: hypothetical protein PLF88_11290 [Opitutaceae bacterium]|nr:hypothetical protein [Opitutaceae bacterium]
MHDYDAVFAAGGCFVFALRLHERFHWNIRGIRTPTHVWGVKDGRGVDVRGTCPEVVLAAFACGCDAAPPIMDFSVADVRAEIAKKGYPPDLLEELRLLADCIFDTHERYASVRPPKPEVAALFAKKS